MSKAPYPCRILYIDDDVVFCRLVERDLQRHGYQVMQASSGEAGEAQARIGGFDAICLDHYMPVQDGLATLEKLRELPGLPPVIMVTGSEDVRIAVASLNAGATTYVIKDSSDEFLSLLRMTINDVLAHEQLRLTRDQALRDLHEAHDRAEQLAEDRAMLMREVNHRVANSLQLLISLAMLQENSTNDPAIRAALAEMQGRIFAVAQVHRRLYTSDDVRSVALDDYLEGLLTEISRSIGGDVSAQIQISFQGVQMKIATDKAIPLGMILVELVTNAMKYAYPNGGKGPVRVVLDRKDAEGILLVEDEGVGYDGLGARTGLGQQVIHKMAGTFSARVERCESLVGVRVGVYFPLDVA
jgi:two-component sensor histidine kinase